VTIKPKFGDGGWEPHQNEFNLMLWYPDFQLRALAQIFVNTVPKANTWISNYNDVQRILLVTPYTPNSTSDVYLPYLYEYALCILAGNPIPSDEISMLNLFVLTDPRFGGVAEYQSPASPGRYNDAAWTAMLNAMEDSGSGAVGIIPQSQYGYAFQNAPTPLTHNYLGIQGYGSGRSRLVWEPTSAGANQFLKVDSAGTGDTTSIGCSIRGIQIEGWNPDYLTAAQKNNRHAKSAIYSSCTSHLHIDDVTVKHWATGSATYGAEGGSIGIESRGKEFLYVDKAVFLTDKPVVLRRNTKELSSFDADTYNFTNFDFRMPIGADKYADEYAFTLEGDLEIHEVRIGDEFNVSGGSGVFIWDTAALTRGSSGLTIEHGRAEQQYGTSKWNIRINLPGSYKLQKLLVNKFTCNFETGGIYLGGVFQSKLSDVTFPRTSLQASSQNGLEFAAGTGYPNGVQDITLDNFLIPDLNPGVPTPLFNFGGATVKFTTADAQVGKNQLSSRMLIG